MIPNNDNTQQEGAYRHNRIKALYVKSFSFFILLPSKSERKKICNTSRKCKRQKRINMVLELDCTSLQLYSLEDKMEKEVQYMSSFDCPKNLNYRFLIGNSF